MKDRDRAARRPHGKPGRRKAKSAVGVPGWAIGLGVAVGLLVLVGVGVGGWLLFAGRANRSANEGGANQPLDISREPVAVRTRRAAVGLDISNPVAASPDPWAVTVDTVRPAAGLRSVFAWPEADPAAQPAAILFARPDAGRAAVLAHAPRPKTWVRYDLTAVDPVGRVDLGNYEPGPNDTPSRALTRGVPFVTDLSPSGNRLAIQANDNPPRMHVWAAEGNRVATLRPVDPDAPATWLGFLDDDRLLTLEGGQLRLRDVGTGRVAYTAAGKFRGPVALSPARTWAAAFDGTAFVLVRTADGTVGGRTPTPALRPNAGQFHGEAHGAFSPDGSLFLASRTASGAMGFFRCLSVWDVATGKPVDSGDHSVGGGLPEHVQWCGPRQLLLGGSRLVDLDLGLVTGAGGYRSVSEAIVAPTTPDGRLWYMPLCKRAYQPSLITDVLSALEGSRHRDAVEKTGLVLAACGLPPEAKDRIAAHKAAATLGKMTVRVEVREDDPAFRRQAGEALADALASVGCRVSPTADGVARLTLSPVKSDLVLKRGVGQPGFRVEEVVPGKIVGAKVEVLDGAGAVRWSAAFDVTEPDSTADAVAVVRKKMVDQLGRLLAGRENVGGGELPPLDVANDIRIDGLPDPPKK